MCPQGHPHLVRITLRATSFSAYFDVMGAVAFEADTVALLIRSSGGTGFSIQAMRIGPSGTIVTAPFIVARQPFALDAGGDQLLARRSTEAVAGWENQGHIRIARLAP